MRIGIMLRHYDQHQGGVRVYTRRLLDAMLGLDSGHEFVLLYRNPDLVGTYADRPRVVETATLAAARAAYRGTRNWWLRRSTRREAQGITYQSRP